VDLRDRVELVRRELEREELDVAADEVARRAERGRPLGLAFARPLRNRDLEREQLVEREPPPPALRLVGPPRAVQRGERVGDEREVEPLPKLRREGGRDGGSGSRAGGAPGATAG